VGLLIAATRHDLAIDIGGIAVRVSTDSPSFLTLLEERYAGFVNSSGGRLSIELKIDLVPPGRISAEEDVRVCFESGRWSFERSDFVAEWAPKLRRGRVRQSAYPYSIDSVLRILHTLLLAREGGFLVHAASAVRNGRAFLFAGLSGAGKTTISRLAPSDVTLLTDEISYVRRQEDGYYAFGTPFTGELEQPGENLRAPVSALYFLARGAENSVEPVRGADAARLLLGNILFFAQDRELVRLVFDSACELVRRVPVYRLAFVPDSRVWEMIA